MLSPVPRWTDFPGILSLRSSIPRDSCNMRAYHWDNSRDELLGRWVCTKQECWRGMGRYWEKEYFLLKRKKIRLFCFCFLLDKSLALTKWSLGIMGFQFWRDTGNSNGSVRNYLPTAPKQPWLKPAVAHFSPPTRSPEPGHLELVRLTVNE